jgi:predicted lipid-binding transport protein (Tim44 family)
VVGAPLRATALLGQVRVRDLVPLAGTVAEAETEKVSTTEVLATAGVAAMATAVKAVVIPTRAIVPALATPRPNVTLVRSAGDRCSASVAWLAMVRAANCALLAAGLVLFRAGSAFAQAGGGSSGFGGGGGGGGGGFSGGGGSGSGGGSPVVVLLFFGAFGIFLIYLAIHSVRYRRKVRERDERVRTASAEAAEDDTYFAASDLEAAARDLFVACQEAWDARDRERLASLVGPDLLVEWNRRLDDFDRKGWHNRVSVLSPPRIEYVGLVNREDDTEDRAVVRITASLRSFVLGKGGQKIMRKGSKSEEMKLCEYWTLARSGDSSWMVVSIEQRAEGDHHLDEEIVPSPWSDTQRLSDEAVTELAVEDGLPPGFTTADLAQVDFDGDARARALDLSLADARFAPDVLEAAARRSVAAWAQAVDGDDAALEAVASPEAVTALLSAGDASRKTRLVVRGPQVRSIRIVGVDVEREPATMTIEVEMAGRRYVEDRDTAVVVSGSKGEAAQFTETWTLAMDGREDAPWRLIDSGLSRPGTPSPLRERSGS